MPGDKNYRDIKHKKENFVFFLGGQDAEMLTIRDILREHNLNFHDKDLKWGAKLSDYKEELKEINEDQTAVLIELTIDIPVPENAIIIDHHNEKENKPSSLEQIADLLNIKLNRWQQLIAANDRGHIRALKEICASENEIKKIRRKDKDAQGVTEKDEELAEESIKKFNTKKNHITVIKSLTDKFSPITDLMYGKTDKLLIYNDNSLLYIGNGKPKLIKKYKNLVDKQKAFYGGGEKGYFGMLVENNNEETIKELVGEVIETLNKEEEEKIYSYHIFLFPFKWKLWKFDNNAALEDKFNVKEFKETLIKSLGSNWERKQFSLNYYNNYNEYNYFYEYVREILYDLGENLKTEYDLGKDLKTKQTKDNDKLINHFECKISKSKKLYYNIKLCDSEATTYNLEIDSILLNVYSTGTAVLSFHLRNKDKKHSSKEDILKINKYGRRLYVPFFDLDPDSIYTGETDNTNSQKVLNATKHNEIPDAIWIGGKEELAGKSNLYEDFEKYKNKDNFKFGPFLLPKFIEELFPEKFYLVHEKQGCNSDGTKDKKYKIYLRPVLDDRMHVVCWYGNTDLVNELNKIKECNDFDLGDSYLNDNRKDKSHYFYETRDWWYSYIFVDSPEPMHTDRFIKQKLVKDSTYSRWVEWGTLYGMSRYSLVILTSSFSDLDNNNVTFLVKHLQTMYYKMAELCLLQRATVLSYAGEITNISNLTKPSGNENKDKNYDNEISARIEDIYKFYILFLNKINFKEVTAQEQGIEMYNLMQKQMRIAEDVNDLDREIKELHLFATHLEETAQTEEDRKQTEKMNALTGLGAIFLPFSLLIAFFALLFRPTDKIPKFIFDTNSMPNFPFITALSLIIVLGLIFVIYINKRLELKIMKKLFGKIKRKQK
ncbi:MAG: hypothetical protein IIA48_05685 [Bacteroidetes bacterium]|nr:hypothetical protein [Bacteroidota bacterium]